MIEILKQLDLSDEASVIYINCLGRGYLTFYEMYSLFPDIPHEEFSNYITELINKGLLVESKLSESKILIHYLALPPYQPLLNFFARYEELLANLDNVIGESIVTIVQQTITEEKTVDFDSILHEFEVIKQDINEEMLLDRADLEQYIKGREGLEKLQNSFSELQQRVKERAQIQSRAIIIREIYREIEDLNLKENAFKLIQNLFETKLDVMTYNFSNKLMEFIEDDIKKTEYNINAIINEIYHNLEENMKILSRFENKIEEIEEFIRSKKNAFQKELKGFEDLILKTVLGIIQNATQGIYEISRPIKNALKSYLLASTSPEKKQIDKIWRIKSMIKINEEILNIITNSKEEIVFLLPNLREHLSIELLQDLPLSLKIGICSSEPSTDPLVQNCKNINNVEWRHIDNDNIVAMKGDNNYIVIAITQRESTDPLKDCFGFGTNFEPLINILLPIINLTWESAR